MEKANQNEINHFIRIIVIVIAIFVVFYFVTVFTTGRKKGDYTKKQSTPVVIQYDEIILGNLYHQKVTDYYVLIEEKEDPYLSLFRSLLKQESTKKDGIPYYTADLSSAFNQKFIGETTYESTLKVSGTTLLHIQNGSIVAHYETSEAILSFLQSLRA